MMLNADQERINMEAIMTSHPKDRAGPKDSAGVKTDEPGKMSQLEAQLDTYKRTLTEIYEQYDKKIEELSLIRRIGDSVRTTLDLEDLCRRIVDAVAREISLNRLSLLLADLERQVLSVRASFDTEEDETRYYPNAAAQRLPLAAGSIGRAVTTGQPVLLAFARPDQDPLGREQGPAVSLLYLPLVARGRMVGLLSLSRPATQPFGDDDVRILTIISDQAATALANVQLFNDLAAANVRLQESERQARQTSLYLENLLEAANDVIFTLDDQGRITYVNQKVEAWGYGKDVLIGRAIQTLMPERDSETEVAGWLVSRKQPVLEVEMHTASGERRDVLLSVSRIEAAGGLDPARSTYLVMARDITQRTQLERQLFHSEKLASIGILAAGVAHEVGNPLSAISGYTQILQGGASADEAREYLEAIEEQTARIKRIIEDLLNYSRPGTGHRSDIDLTEAIPSIMSMLGAQRAFKDLNIQYDFNEKTPQVHMDRDHLAQIIVNIALNAAQAMTGGGRLKISLAEDNDRVRITLADTGPGIPDKVRDRIFDPFFTTKPVGQGTGLGLAVCYRIVESYDGCIELDSQSGRGATFTIRLPAAHPERR